MNIFTLKTLCFFSIVIACASVRAQSTEPELSINGRELKLQINRKCPQDRPTRKDLEKYLVQYDPKREPNLDIFDETPWTNEEIRETQIGLVKDGFHYPNGQESVITWMDFDGDGICDFTASAGIGGMKSIDRMFLFRGLPNGKFKLVDSYYTYMEGRSILIPYIQINISGEKLPILSKGYLIMQWENNKNQFITCDTLSNSKNIKKREFGNDDKSKVLLTELCPHAQDIYKWAIDQLPQKNEVAY